jgi:hypothetical protein
MGNPSIVNRNTRFVLAQLPKWFEDYDECHPHKGPEITSPVNIGALRLSWGHVL